MEKINTTKKISEVNMETKLSTLWLFAVLNYLYCDVLGLTDPELLKTIITGNTGAIQLTQGFLLIAGIIMEIPIVMVVLSRILKYKTNRWANIVAGVIMTIVQISSLFVGIPTIYYIFFSIIEIICTLFIVWCAWKWKNLENNLNS